MMGDKTAARALAAEAQRARRCPAPRSRSTDRGEALKVAKEIGFPLIIKAASAAAGAACAWCTRPASSTRCSTRRRAKPAARSAIRAVFLEKYIPRAKHIEVQILGDQHGNVVHLHERDCSVQRRHQKVVEIAPSVGSRRSRAPGALRRGRAHRAARSATTTPARSSSSTTSTRNEWFFIEMNPRIQVEHTVTEVVTGIDLVRAQILIAQGHALHGPKSACRAQDDVPRNGYAMQCRVTTEDPENNFMPDYGKILDLSLRGRLRHPARRRHGLRRRGRSRRSTTRCW